MSGSHWCRWGWESPHLTAPRVSSLHHEGALPCPFRPCAPLDGASAMLVAPSAAKLWSCWSLLPPVPQHNHFQIKPVSPLAVVSPWVLFLGMAVGGKGLETP